MTTFRSPLRDALPPIEPGHIPESMRPHIDAIRRNGRMRRIAGTVIGVFFYGALLIFAAFVAWVLAQVVDRTPPTTVRDELLTKEVALDGNLIDKITILSKQRSCDLQLRYFIFDGAREIHIYELDPIPASGLLKAEAPFLREFKVPSNLNPGDATFRLQREWSCPGNFIHKTYPITGSSPTMAFRILPPRKP